MAASDQAYEAAAINARWASQFMPADTDTAPTSLARRRRYKEDQEAFATMEADRNQAQQFNQLTSSRAGTQIYLQQERARLQTELQAERLAQTAAHQQNSFDLERQRTQIAWDRLEADKAKSEAAAAVQREKDRNENISASHTRDFATGVTEAREKFGIDTPEFFEAVIDLNSKNPAADKDFKTPYVNAALGYVLAKNTAQIKQDDPLRLAGPLNRQLSGFRLRETAHAKEFEKLQEDNPWLTSTTGPFKDGKTGRELFGTGAATDKAEELTAVTPATKAVWQRYNSLLSERNEIATKVPQLQSRLDAVLSGDTAAAADTPANAPHGTPVADKFIVGKQYPDGAGTMTKYLGDGKWERIEGATPNVPHGEPSTDKFVIGKQYKDSAGNTATYRGNGQWN